MPCGDDYVTIMVIHPNDDTLSKLKEGQKFKRGEKMFLEGNDGNATGYHFHISAATGKFTGSGWTQNSKSSWVLSTTGKTIKPEQAFWVDDTFTTIKSAGGITFKHLSASAKAETAKTTKTTTAATTTTTKTTTNATTTKTQATVSKGTVVYRVMIGSYKDKANAEALAKQAKAKGFDVAIVAHTIE